MKWVGIGVLVFVVGIIAYIRLLPPNTAKVAVVNKGSEQIQSGEVELCGEKFSFSKLEPGQSFKQDLKVTRDCHYEVTATFLSGKKVSGGVGYVTHGMDFNDQILVTDEAVELAAKTSP